jgi:Flp pilus assembly protein TadG
VQKHKLRRQDGQTLILIALALPMLFAVVALVIDGAHLFVQRRSVQNAADASALAVAQGLPMTQASAQVLAQQWADKNLSGGTVVATTPYKGDAGRVLVTVTKPSPTFFAQVLGFTSAQVSARAVASVVVGGPNTTAFFAHSTSCSTHDYTLDISGNFVNIQGILVSNGSVHIHGNNETFAELDWRKDTAFPGCTAPDISGAPAPVFTNGVQSYTTPRDYPVTFNAATIPCTYNAASFNFTGSMPAGVYCATGSVSFSGNGGSGNITVIARCIDFGGNSWSLTAYYPQLLLYATGTPAQCAANHDLSIDFHGNDTSIGNGATNTTLYAPNGGVSLTGNSGNTIFGFVEAETIFTHGNTWSWTGTGPGGSGGAGAVSLDE